MLRKKEKLIKVEKRATASVSLMERLEQLRSTPDVVVRLRRIGKNAGELSGAQYNIMNVDPATFVDDVGRDYGGGRYIVYFVSDYAPLKTTTGRLEEHVLEIAGRPKSGYVEADGQPKQTAGLKGVLKYLDEPTLALAGKFMEALRPNPGVSEKILEALVQKALDGGGGVKSTDIAAIYDKLLDRNQGGGVEDMMTLFRGFMELQSQMRVTGPMGARPNITTGDGGQSGQIWNAIGRFFEFLATQGERYASAQGNAPPVSPGAPEAALGPSREAASLPDTGFAFGAPPREASGASQPEPAFDRPAPAPLSLNPIASLRAMMSRKEDPASVAQRALMALDAYASLGEETVLGKELGDFLSDPEAAIGKLSTYVPELLDGTEYTDRVWSGIRAGLQQYREQMDMISGMRPEPEPEREELVTDATIPDLSGVALETETSEAPEGDVQNESGRAPEHEGEENNGIQRG